MVKSLKTFHTIIGYTPNQIEFILQNKKEFYKEFYILKTNGKKRTFHPAEHELKHIQDKIQGIIFSKILLPSHIQGCVKGRSNVTNALFHLGKKYKFKTDLVSYFDFVNNKKVFFALKRLGFSNDVAHLITKLTTYEGHLPQGTSTSPFLANIIALEMDDELLKLCCLHKIIYTRFVDDLCFSSQSDFEKIALDFAKIINSYSFFLGRKKTFYKKGNLLLTGCFLKNNYLSPTSDHLGKFYSSQTSQNSKDGLLVYFKSLTSKKFQVRDSV